MSEETAITEELLVPGPPAPLSRLTVLERIAHQAGDDSLTESTWSFDLPLTSEERKLERPLVIGAAWQEVSAGHLGRVSMLLLANREGTRLQAVPTEEEKQEIARRVVEVAFAAPAPANRTQWDDPIPEPCPGVVVPPGQSARFCPADVGRVLLRCPGGPARALLTLWPE